MSKLDIQQYLRSLNLELADFGEEIQASLEEFLNRADSDGSGSLDVYEFLQTLHEFENITKSADSSDFTPSQKAKLLETRLGQLALFLQPEMTNDFLNHLGEAVYDADNQVDVAAELASMPLAFKQAFADLDDLTVCYLYRAYNLQPIESLLKFETMQTQMQKVTKLVGYLDRSLGISLDEHALLQSVAIALVNGDIAYANQCVSDLNALAFDALSQRAKQDLESSAREERSLEIQIEGYREELNQRSQEMSELVNKSMDYLFHDSEDAFAFVEAKMAEGHERMEELRFKMNATRVLLDEVHAQQKNAKSRYFDAQYKLLRELNTPQELVKGFLEALLWDSVELKTPAFEEALKRYKVEDKSQSELREAMMNMDQMSQNYGLALAVSSYEIILAMIAKGHEYSFWNLEGVDVPSEVYQVAEGFLPVRWQGTGSELTDWVQIKREGDGYVIQPLGTDNLGNNSAGLILIGRAAEEGGIRISRDEVLKIDLERMLGEDALANAIKGHKGINNLRQSVMELNEHLIPVMNLMNQGMEAYRKDPEYLRILKAEVENLKAYYTEHKDDLREQVRAMDVVISEWENLRGTASEAFMLQWEEFSTVLSVAESVVSDDGVLEELCDTVMKLEADFDEKICEEIVVMVGVVGGLALLGGVLGGMLSAPLVEAMGVNAFVANSLGVSAEVLATSVQVGSLTLEQHVLMFVAQMPFRGLSAGMMGLGGVLGNDAGLELVSRLYNPNIKSNFGEYQRGQITAEQLAEAYVTNTVCASLSTFGFMSAGGGLAQMAQAMSTSSRASIMTVGSQILRVGGFVRRGFNRLNVFSGNTSFANEIRNFAREYGSEVIEEVMENVAGKAGGPAQAFMTFVNSVNGRPNLEIDLYKAGVTASGNNTFLFTQGQEKILLEELRLTYPGHTIEIVSEVDKMLSTESTAGQSLQIRITPLENKSNDKAEPVTLTFVASQESYTLRRCVANTGIGRLQGHEAGLQALGLKRVGDGYQVLNSQESQEVLEEKLKAMGMCVVGRSANHIQVYTGDGEMRIELKVAEVIATENNVAPKNEEKANQVPKKQIRIPQMPHGIDWVAFAERQPPVKDVLPGDTEAYPLDAFSGKSHPDDKRTALGVAATVDSDEENGQESHEVLDLATTEVAAAGLSPDVYLERFYKNRYPNLEEDLEATNWNAEQKSEFLKMVTRNLMGAGGGLC